MRSFAPLLRFLVSLPPSLDGLGRRQLWTLADRVSFFSCGETGDSFPEARVSFPDRRMTGPACTMGPSLVYAERVIQFRRVERPGNGRIPLLDRIEIA